ncbi:MAG: hypothetical protein K0Q51_1264 [Rickettsiaceae bacterium]|jgi:hypothetical protein|nr:hypothetical protein [Rickettsiaceae bacterium]
MKVTINNNLKKIIEYRLAQSLLAPFKADLLKIVNMYSNIKLIDYILKSSNKVDLSLGEFSIISYSLQVTSNNINSLSRKFTGLEANNLQLDEALAQKLLQASSFFKNMIDTCFPNKKNNSWFNNERLTTAHCKDFLKFYETNKGFLNEKFFEKSQLENLLYNIKNLFSELFAINDIMIFDIEGHIISYTQITEKAIEISKINQAHYSDLILAHKQGLIIEQIAQISGCSKDIFEYTCCHKLLIQAATEAFKQFLQFYTGEEWVVTQHLIALHQLKELRNNIAHSEDITKDYRSRIMEGYSQLHPYNGDSFLYAALRNCTTKIIFIFQNIDQPENSLDISLQSKNLMHENSLNDVYNSENLITGAKKIGRKNYNHSKLSSSNSDEKLLDYCIKEVQLKKRTFEISSELSNYLLNRDKIFKILENSHKKFLQQKSLAMKFKDINHFTNGGFFYNSSKEETSSLYEMFTLLTQDPNALTYVDKPGIITSFFRMMLIADNGQLLFRLLIIRGLNMVQLNKAAGNIFESLISAKPQRLNNEDLLTYKAILRSFEKTHSSLLKETLDKQIYAYEIDQYQRLEVYNTYERKLTLFCKPVKANIVSLTAIYGNIELFKLLNSYGGDVNQLFEFNIYMTLGGSLKLVKENVSTTLLNYYLELYRYDYALAVVESESFKAEYNKELITIGELFNKKYLKNLTTLDYVINILINNHELIPSDFRTLSEIGKIIHQKGGETSKTLISLGLVNLRSYKIALEKKSGWVTKILLEENAYFIAREALQKKEFSIIEDIIIKGFKATLTEAVKNEKLEVDDYISCQNSPFAKDFIFDNLSASKKALLLNKQLSMDNQIAVQYFMAKGILQEIKEATEYKSLPPLNIAILRKSTSMIKLLLLHGEKPSKAQYELAKKIGDAEIIESIERSLNGYDIIAELSPSYAYAEGVTGNGQDCTLDSLGNIEAHNINIS